VVESGSSHVLDAEHPHGPYHEFEEQYLIVGVDQALAHPRDQSLCQLETV
jgi:hypothetical protein